MTRSTYLLNRLLFAVGTVVVAVMLNFALFRLAPGDPLAQLYRVQGVTPDAIEGLREQYGLDDPIYVQFWDYVQSLAHGDLGRSYSNSAPVSSQLTDAYLNTAPLVVTGLVFAIVGGVLLGVATAVRRGRPADTVGVGAALICYSLPIQWLGLILIFAFNGILPSGGQRNEFLIDASPWQRFVDTASHLILPAFTLGIVILGQYALVTRAAMLETLGEDYVLASRARGFRRGRIIRRHALRNALLPISTLVALSLGAIVSGTILVETVFSWPGIGRLTYDAVLDRDWPMLQGAFLVITVTVVALNFCADILYQRLDPRVVE